MVLHANLTGAFLTASQSLYLLNEGVHMMFMGAYVDHVMLPKMAAYAVVEAGLETMVTVLTINQNKLTIHSEGSTKHVYYQ